MARVVCRECGLEVPAEDVNVGEGVAFCRSCGTLSRLKEIAATTEDEVETAADPDRPPSGCSLHDDGVETTIRASARSLGSAVGLLLFAIPWISIVSVFVVIALGATWYHLFGPLPSWFPTPWGQGSNPGPGMPLGMTIFLWLFLTPFIAV